MIVHTDYLWFNTKKRQEFVRITDEVVGIVKASGVSEGTVLVSAMHITAGVVVNDWEDGLIDDFQVWLEKLAPAGLDYRHHQTGEDNADAHLKRTVVGHQVTLPITKGGCWTSVRGNRSFTRSSTGVARSASSSKCWGSSRSRAPPAWPDTLPSPSHDWWRIRATRSASARERCR